MVESLHQYSLCIRDFLKIPITVEYLLDMQQDGVQNLGILRQEASKPLR